MVAVEHQFLTIAGPIVNYDSLTLKANAGIKKAADRNGTAPREDDRTIHKEECEMADSVLIFGKNT